MRAKKRRTGRPMPGLKAARERAFLSQDELSRRSGVGQATIWDLEAGPDGRGAYFQTIRKLAAALDVDPEVLVTEPDREEMLTT